MKIFISFAKEQAEIAELIYRKLLAANYKVFFASSDIRASDGYDDRIRREVAKADRMIFLASRESLSEGKYTLTELQMFSEKWPDPSGRVMSVALDDVSYDNLPPYLGAVTSALRPKGNIPSELVAAVVNVWPIPARRWRLWGMLAALVVIVAVIVFIVFKITTEVSEEDKSYIPPIEFNTGPEAITLIYHSHTLDRKDTFQIDPDRTVLSLKNQLKLHYKITVPDEQSKNTPKGGYFREERLYANKSCLNNETEELLKAGVKEFDVIEFKTIKSFINTMGCRNKDVVIIIEGIHSPNPVFTLNGKNIPEKIEKIGNAHYFYFDLVRECNPATWKGKLILGDEEYFLDNPKKIPNDEPGIIMKFDLIPNPTPTLMMK